MVLNTVFFWCFWSKIFDREQQQQQQEEHMTPCNLGAGGPCRGAVWIKNCRHENRAYPNLTASAKELNRNLYFFQPGSWTWWNLCPMHGLQYQCCVHSQITQVSTLDKCDFLQSLASTTPSSSSKDSVDDPSAKSISSFQPWNACDLLDKIHPSDGDVAGSKPETVRVKISTCSLLRSSYGSRDTGSGTVPRLQQKVPFLFTDEYLYL